MARPPLGAQGGTRGNSATAGIFPALGWPEPALPPPRRPEPSCLSSTRRPGDGHALAPLFRSRMSQGPWLGRARRAAEYSCAVTSHLMPARAANRHPRVRGASGIHCLGQGSLLYGRRSIGHGDQSGPFPREEQRHRRAPRGSKPAASRGALCGAPGAAARRERAPLRRVFGQSGARDHPPDPCSSGQGMRRARLSGQG
jgi:hypothetical protein